MNICLSFEQRRKVLPVRGGLHFRGVCKTAKSEC